MPMQTNNDVSFGRGAQVTTRGGVQVITAPDGRSTAITDRGRVTTVTTTPDGNVAVMVNGRPTTDPRALNEAIARVASTSRVPGEPTVTINGRALQNDELIGLGAAAGAGATALAALVLYIVLHTAGRIIRRATNRRADESPRLLRIEQAVESIAIEVERASEAQRYSAMLLTERLPDKPPLDRAAPPAPVRAEGRVMTPH